MAKQQTLFKCRRAHMREILTERVDDRRTFLPPYLARLERLKAERAKWEAQKMT